MLYFCKGNGTRTSKTMFPSVWCANTQIQKYKYTNTFFFKVADMSNKCYIFEKVMVRGPQKQSFHLSDMQIQIHKNTNTQILLWSKLQICLTYAIFSERKWYEDIKNNAPSCLTCKYKYTKTQTHIYTNTQIQIWSKFQIGLTWLIFLKR